MTAPRRSLGRTLVVATLATSAAVLVVACTVFAVHAVATSRRTLRERLAIQAAVVGANSTGALAFDDRRAGEEVLAALAEDPRILAAVVTRADGSPFATYRRPGAPALPLGPDVAPFRVAGEALLLARAIVLRGETVGHIALAAALEGVFERLVGFAGIAVLVVLLAGLAAWLVAQRLRQRVSAPIAALAHAVEAATTAHDYSVTVDEPVDAELRVLVGGFNAMLARIRRREEALRQAKEAAESASRVKTQFLANMSHEIRTPINAIVGYTDITLDSPLTGDQRECLEAVRRASCTLLDVVNDVLDLAKIEAGKLALETIEFRLGDLLGEVLRTFAVRAAQKGIELGADVDPAVPEVLIGDPTRLRQVLVNLVGNAVKFTERGEVIVRVTGAADGPERLVLTCAVSDTGIGIPPDRLESIFEAFTQADGSMTRRYGGTGLGVTIAAQLVDMMGGRIWVQSALGRGSCFQFTVSVGRRACALPATPGPSLDGARILVVDDSAAVRDIIAAMLRRWDAVPVGAGGADEAMAVLTQARAAGEPIAAAVVDRRMPGTDGLALVERMRSTPGLASVPVVVLAPLGDAVDGARAAELQLEGQLSKPVSSAGLLALLTEALGVEPARDAGAVAACEVLLAAASPTTRRMLHSLLRRCGHCVEAVEDGGAAVARAGAHAFDLLVLDLFMPGVDGLAAVRAIRAAEQATGRRVGIVALAPPALASDPFAWSAAGIDACIAKPIDLVALSEAIALAVAVGTAHAGDSRGDADVCDAALAAVRERGVAVAAAVAGFREDSGRLLDDVRSALAHGDARVLETAAGRLARLLVRLGADVAADAARRVERLGRERDLRQAADAFAALALRVDALEPALCGLAALRAGPADRPARSPAALGG